MKNIFLATLILIHSFAWAGAPTTPAKLFAVKPATSFAAAFPEKKMSTQDFLNKLEGQIPKDSLELLKNKWKPVLGEKFEYEVLGSNKIVFRAGGNETLFEVLDLMNGKFKINNKVVNLDYAAAPDVIWDDIQKLFEKKTSSHPFLHLFLPEAHAFLDFGLILGGVVLAAGLYMYNSSNCDNYKSLSYQCDSIKSSPTSWTPANRGALYGNIVNQDHWWKFGIGCSDYKDNVRSCQGYLTCLNTGATSCSYGGTTPAADTPGLIKGYR